MITITEQAATKVRELLERERNLKAALRLRVSFRIQNPNAATTCGCGESFGI